MSFTTVGIPLASGTPSMMLVQKTYLAVSNPNDGFKTLADVLTYEATGTAYTSSGTALANTNVLQLDDPAIDGARVDCDDVSWAASTITASGAVLYRKCSTFTTAALNAANSPLIAFYSFGGDKSSSNGAFTLTIHASGLIELGPQC